MVISSKRPVVAGHAQSAGYASFVKAVNDCIGSEADIYSKAVGDSDIQFAVCREYRGVSPAGGGEFFYQHKLAINPLEDA
jgi:hypothetical protein